MEAVTAETAAEVALPVELPSGCRDTNAACRTASWDATPPQAEFCFLVGANCGATGVEEVLACRKR